MKKLGLILYSILAFIFSLTLATNLFAYLLHYAQVLGSPHFGKWYEPFHILYWYLTVRAPGNQYRISFIAFLVCFSALGFLGFRIYTKLKLNLLGIYGNSRWAKTRELSRMGAFADKGVILGQTQQAHYREIETYLNEQKQRQFRMLRPGQVLFSDDPSHVLVIAPTRWGKGISCVCTTLLCWSHSAIVYDIKGELFEITSGWRRAFSHILRFDPSGYDSVHFNPLWEIQRNTPNDVSQAQNIAELLCNPNGDDLKPDHWRESAAQILVGAILYVLYSDDEHDKSLHGVYHLLNDPNKPMEDVLNQMLTLEHNAVQESARGMLNKAPNERSGVLSTAVRFLALYQDPIVAANTAYSDFSIKDLTAQEHPCTLYLCINPKDAARLKPLTRLLLSLIATTLTSGFHTNKNRLLFLIDEFPSLGRLSFFEQALAFFAGFNVKCMLIAQSFNQLFATYGERNSILDNCKHKAILGVGSPQDAKLVSDFLGTYSVNRKTVSQSGTLGSIIARSRSTSYMETEKKLMTVDELLRLPFEDFILITAGQYPYRGRKLMYYLDPRFKDRVKLPTLANWSDQLQELPKRRLQLPWLSENALVVLKKNTATAVQTFKRQLHSDKAVDPVAAQQAVMQIESHASSKGMMSDGPEISKAFQAQREENTTQDEPTIKEPVDDISAPNRIPPETF